MRRRLLLALGRFLRPGKSVLVALFLAEGRIAGWWAAAAWRRVFLAQWGIPPQPEHFDHRINLYFHWVSSADGMWVERGVVGALALNGGTALELACGDGFNSRNFYSTRCDRLIACDVDSAAITTARRVNPAPNVEYVIADIRFAMPAGQFDNILWDAAIEHFTPTETDLILRAITERLRPGGILSGYTNAMRSDGRSSLEHHKREFISKHDLLATLAPHFANAVVFETFSTDRHNLYFYASAGPIPLSNEWPHAVHTSPRDLTAH